MLDILATLKPRIKFLEPLTFNEIYCFNVCYSNDNASRSIIFALSTKLLHVHQTQQTSNAISDCKFSVINKLWYQLMPSTKCPKIKLNIEPHE